MTDYKLIKPKITDLPIESGQKVFKFLDEALSVYRLEKSQYVDRFKRLTIGEQYFVAKYSIVYFDHYNPKSFLRKWIEIRETGFDDNFQTEKYEIRYRAQSIVSFCKERLPSLKRRFIHTLLHYDFIKAYNNIDDVKSITDQMMLGRRDRKIIKDQRQQSIRIPITLKLNVDSVTEKIHYVDSTEALDFFTKCFSELVPPEELNNLVRNTLRSEGSDNTLNPLKVLFIHVESKGLLMSHIYRFYQYYKSEVKSNIQSRRRMQLQLKDQNSNKIREMLQVDDTNYTKYDFLCAFYFSFPILRESYFKAKTKSPNLQLSDYLRTECRNIKLRKKSN